MYEPGWVVLDLLLNCHPLAMSKSGPRHGLQKDEIMSLYGGHELYPAVAGTYWLRKLEFETLPLFLAGASVQVFVQHKSIPKNSWGLNPEIDQHNNAEVQNISLSCFSKGPKRSKNVEAE